MVMAIGHLATSSLLQAETVSATILGLNPDGSRTGHRSRAAISITRRPWAPWSHFAIHN